MPENQLVQHRDRLPIGRLVPNRSMREILGVEIWHCTCLGLSVNNRWTGSASGGKNSFQNPLEV